MNTTEARDGAESVFLTTWALVLQAIRNRGQDEALRILGALDAGRAHVSMHFELCAGPCLIVATLREGERSDLLLTVSADALQGRRIAH